MTDDEDIVVILSVAAVIFLLLLPISFRVSHISLLLFHHVWSCTISGK
jgi:hypothetical protein